MAKSKIIKDLANGEVDTITALKRAKVLVSDLENDGILRWLDYEISGYPEGVAIPSYRKTHGILMGSYFRGSMATHMTWNHVSIPLGKMPDDIKELLLSVEFHESVEALRKLAQTSQDSGNQLGKTIPADLFSAIATYNDDPYMIITSARVVVGEHIISNIFSVIENKLLDMLKMLNLRKSLKKRVERGKYTCACCGEQFLPIRADARYCSNACRQKGYRQRKTIAHTSLLGT